MFSVSTKLRLDFLKGIIKSFGIMLLFIITICIVYGIVIVVYIG